MPLPHHSKARSSDRSAQTVPPVMAIVGLWRGRAGAGREAVHGWSSAVTASPTGFQHGERGGFTEFHGVFRRLQSDRLIGNVWLLCALRAKRDIVLLRGTPRVLPVPRIENAEANTSQSYS